MATKTNVCIWLFWIGLFGGALTAYAGHWLDSGFLSFCALVLLLLCIISHIYLAVTVGYIRRLFFDRN